MTVEGVLPVWKPAGMTSHDVVAQVRRMLRIKRIGHTGTLDPSVTGVLPLCVGRATRIVEYIQDLPKQYEAEMCIGYSTDTEDSTGAVTDRTEHVELSEAQVRRVISSFVGALEQVPPMYSAVKVNGKRLYELAREGREVERKPRQVTVYDIVISDIQWSKPYPKIRFTVTCSKGTYIRTLCVDIGRALGYPAVMTSLVRTATGNIRPEQCHTMDQIDRHAANGTIADCLIPIDQALIHLPAYTVNADDAAKALTGRALTASALIPAVERHHPLLRLYAADRRFIGLFSMDANVENIVPQKIFS